MNAGSSARLAPRGRGLENHVPVEERHRCGHVLSALGTSQCPRQLDHTIAVHVRLLSGFRHVKALMTRVFGEGHVAALANKTYDRSYV